MKKRKENYRLPDSELAVMQVIWNEDEPIGSGKVVAILSEERGWSRSTIQALLARLEEKGFLICEKKGRLNLYRSVVKEKKYVTNETKSFLENFYHNSYRGLIASLVEEDAISEDDIEDIISIIKTTGKEEKE